MSAVCDVEILARLSLPDHDENRLRIEPFLEHTKFPGLPSHGLGCYGYDLRVDCEYRRIDVDTWNRMVLAGRVPYILPGDADVPWLSHEATRTKPIVIPPSSFVLAHTYESIRIPRDCFGVIMGKSTNARMGIDLNTTVIEPEWFGRPTLEISNVGPIPVAVRPGDGVCQLVLFRNTSENYRLMKSYADRKVQTYQGDMCLKPSTV
jgi:dCTP deaminase